MRYKRYSLLIAGLVITTIIYGQGPFTIGTINPNDSIVVIYDVQINNPLVPPTTTQISNQGTVSGSNFSNQVTDDPDSGPANDPTITFINLFLLPVNFFEFRAFEKTGDVELAWKVTESGTLKYEVERSADGRTFFKIGEVTANGGAGVLNYSFLDASAITGNNYYRLRIIESSPILKYTQVVRVSLGANATMIGINPNPVTTKMVNLEMSKVPRGVYQFSLINSLGQLVFVKTIDHRGGSSSELIQLPEGLGKGIYVARFEGSMKTVNKVLIIQ